jgi:hypothetical protein
MTQGLTVGANSTSLVAGTFAITQLLTRDSSKELGVDTFSDWRLDGSMPYSPNNPQSKQIYQFPPQDISGVGRAMDRLADAPEMTGFLQAYCFDHFQQYFMFRPATAGSIWATLGTSTWNWGGSIGPTSITDPRWTWIGPPSFYDSQTITPSHQHPEWRLTHQNTGSDH